MQSATYAADKPSDCSDCYFWHQKGCSLGKENCYYLTSTPKEAKSECMGCPYGRDHPCIGWCTKKILQEHTVKRNEQISK